MFLPFLSKDFSYCIDSKLVPRARIVYLEFSSQSLQKCEQTYRGPDTGPCENVLEGDMVAKACLFSREGAREGEAKFCITLYIKN